MTHKPNLTEAAVRRLATDQSFERGEDYYHRGAVYDVVRRGDTLQAEVEGSQYEPYRVTANSTKPASPARTARVLTTGVASVSTPSPSC